MAISDISESPYPSTIRIPPVLILLHLSQHEVLYQSLQPETSLLATEVLFLQQIYISKKHLQAFSVLKVFP